MNNKPNLYTCFSPALLHLYDLSNSVVVIIDIFRATSTIATALYNGARSVIPVDSVSRCIELGKQIEGITAGERDGKIAEGLEHGNSPFEYTREFIEGNIGAYYYEWNPAAANGIRQGCPGNYYRVIFQSFSYL